MGKTYSSANPQNAHTQDTGADSARADFSKMIDFSKFIPNGGKMPGFDFKAFDFQAFLDMQRRHAESLRHVGQQTLENVQALVQRQHEMVQESMHKTAEMLSHAMTPAPAQDKMAKTTEHVRSVFEETVANSQELAAMASKTSSEALQGLTSYMTSTMEELRTVYAAK